MISFSPLDLLYLVLALCCIVVTVMVVLVGSEFYRTARDIRRIAETVEHIAGLAEKVACVVFPGMERVAHHAEAVEERIRHFFTRDSHSSSKK